MIGSFFLFCLMLGLPGQTDVGWEEVEAVAWQNLARISTLRVVWRHSRQSTQERIDYELSMVRFMRESAAPGGWLPRENVAQVLASADQKESSAREPLSYWSRTRELDFWSDRENYQIRNGTPGEWSARSRPRFPDVPSLPDELPRHFSGISILSYGIETKHLFRWWHGTKIHGHFSGGTGNAFPESEIVFPPLGAWQADWSGTRLAFDHWLQDTPHPSRVLGTTLVQGRPCTVVRRTLTRDPVAGSVMDQGGGIVVLAWADLERGALPLRLEMYRCSSPEGVQNIPDRLTPTDYRKPIPFLVVRDVQLEEVADGVWYPVRGTQEAVGPDRHVVDANTDFRAVPHWLIDWEARKVEIDREMPREMFALRFPDRVIYVSGPTGDIRVTGDANEFGRRAVDEVLAASSPSGGRSRFLIPGVVACCVACAGLAFWRWRSR